MTSASRLFSPGRWSTQNLIRFYFVLFLLSLYFFLTSIKSEVEHEYSADGDTGIAVFSPLQRRRFDQAVTEEEITSGNGNLSLDDPRLLRLISSKFLVNPSPKGKTSPVDWSPVHLTNKEEQQEVSRYILNLFKGKARGTFIEVGANDGEYFSNTMLLEQQHHWTGLLIESDPRPLKKLLSRNRNAWIAKCCLSTNSQPKRLEFLRHNTDEGLSFIPGKRHFIGNEEDYYSFEAQCFPLYSILRTINQTTIDYFSIDIEGAELDVLDTLPWEKVLIKVLSIEVHPKYVDPMKKYMTSARVGYRLINYIKNGYSHDQIYAHESILNELNENLIKN